MNHRLARHHIRTMPSGLVDDQVILNACDTHHYPRSQKTSRFVHPCATARFSKCRCTVAVFETECFHNAITEPKFKETVHRLGLDPCSPPLINCGNQLQLGSLSATLRAASGRNRPRFARMSRSPPRSQVPPPHTGQSASGGSRVRRIRQPSHWSRGLSDRQRPM